MHDRKSSVISALCLASLFVLPLAAEEARDLYEERLGEDFIEKTTFRFRSKFPRTYIDKDFKELLSRRIEVPPILDGMLEDDCWKIADHTKSAFVQWRTKEPNRKQTVVYVCHDDQNLYMAVDCEEPNLKGMRMLSHHPGGRRSWGTAGTGDCIETFIEMGGVGGTGQIFQFIYNIYPEVQWDGIDPPFVPWIGTGYRLAGARGAKRWICELAFPHDGFNTDKTGRVDFRYQGPPRRGEVWGLRVVRNGPKPQRGGDQVRSTWTHNPTGYVWNIPFPTGTIVFEDRNALHNGKLNETEPGSDRPTCWKLATVGAPTATTFAFSGNDGHALLAAKAAKETEGVLISQTIGVLPNVGYRLSARLRKNGEGGRVRVGFDRPKMAYEFKRPNEWETYEFDFFSDPKQREAVFYLSAVGTEASVSIDEIRIEQQIYGAPSGATCLTGNSPRRDLNLDEKELAAVKYTYHDPRTGQERFPSHKRWGTGWQNGIPDPGGTSGWIPVREGSLTKLKMQHQLVQWTHPRPTAGFFPFPEGHEIVIDLGQDYFVRSVEMLPLGTIANMTVSVMPEGSKRFVLSRKLRGEGVLNPPGAVLFGRLRRINSVCRYVKIWFLDGKQGVYFVRVWGEPKGERSGISRFRWKEGIRLKDEERPPYQQFRKLPGPVLMPTPQELTWGQGEFVVRNDTPVLYTPIGRSRGIVDILADEVHRTYGIRLRAIPEAGRETGADARGAIVLGEPRSEGLAARMAKQRGWDVSAKQPGEQGYFLNSSPDGILICGFDQAGTFYGVQTLLQLLVRRGDSSAAARSAEIRDWPYVPLRILDCRGGLTLPLIRALARLKVNTIMGAYHPRMDDYFMNCFPGGPPGGPIEMDDDENWYYLGLGKTGYSRINPCPSHYRRYEAFDGHAARVSTSPGIGAINLVLDEMDGTQGGARWNSDRRCLDRHLTGDVLFTEMILRAYDFHRLFNRKTAFLDSMMESAAEGGLGSYHDMYKAYGRVPEDIHVFCWMGVPGDPESNPEEALRRFERATMLQGSFPLVGRGRLNDFYRPPPGKRVWGIWNTVWGAAGPADQVLTGQFCRRMTWVDGGCNIPFMSQGWNPDNPPIHTVEWARKIGYLQQRFGELALERELPSWREGVNRDFFKVDMRAACNWSHVDPVPYDGKDWLDWGENNDARFLPRDEVQFEEVPFSVIEPTRNGGRSVVVVASQPENVRLRFPHHSSEIPVGRAAASLIFLRTNLRTGHLPGYRITYEGGGYLTVPLDAMGNGSNRYQCYGLYAAGHASKAGDAPRAFFRSARHRMITYFSLFFRVAWMGTTWAGDPFKVTLHEWVNPNPEKTIQSVSVHCPPGRTSNRLEVLFAVTGVAPSPRDLALWKDRKRLPLVAPSELQITPEDVPVIPPDGACGDGENAPPNVYLDQDGEPVCSLTDTHPFSSLNALFRRTDGGLLYQRGVIKLERAQVCRKLALRGLFYWEYHGPKPHYGVTMFRRTDYVVEISSDGRNWVKVAEKKGVCGEDGDHVHPLPQVPIQYLRVKLDAKAYAHPRNSNASMGPGLSWMQLFK